MITVKFYASQDGQEQRQVATLTVQDTTHMLEDPQGYVDLSIPALAAGGADGGVEKVTFDADPHRWARLSPRIFRTPYLSAEVHESAEVTS